VTANTPTRERSTAVHPLLLGLRSIDYCRLISTIEEAFRPMDEGKSLVVEVRLTEACGHVEPDTRSAASPALEHPGSHDWCVAGRRVILCAGVEKRAARRRTMPVNGYPIRANP
jgi:hypothetical protein